MSVVPTRSNHFPPRTSILVDEDRKLVHYRSTLCRTPFSLMIRVSILTVMV